MRWILKLLLVVAATTLGVHYLSNGLTGQSLFTKLLAQRPWQSWFAKIQSAKLPVKLPDPTQLPALPKALSRDASTTETSAFKWVDKKGVVHYSDAAPTQGEQAQMIKVNPATNLIQGSSPPVPEPNGLSPRVAEPAASNSAYSSTLRQAEDVNKIMNQRQQNLDAAINRNH